MSLFPFIYIFVPSYYKQIVQYETVLYISENTLMCVNVNGIIILFCLHIYYMYIHIYYIHKIFNFPSFYILKINIRIVCTYIYSYLYLYIWKFERKTHHTRSVFMYNVWIFRSNEKLYLIFSLFSCDIPSIL